MDIYIKEIDKEIEIEYEYEIENSGIGHYEYWGAPGYDAGHDYVSVESITIADGHGLTDDEVKIVNKVFQNLDENHPIYEKIENEVFDAIEDAKAEAMISEYESRNDCWL